MSQYLEGHDPLFSDTPKPCIEVKSTNPIQLNRRGNLVIPRDAARTVFTTIRIALKEPLQKLQDVILVDGANKLAFCIFQHGGHGRSHP